MINQWSFLRNASCARSPEFVAYDQGCFGSRPTSLQAVKRTAAPLPRNRQDLHFSIISVYSVGTELDEMKTLSPVQQKFILHWGEMGTRWGINRTVAQIHALLFISPKPLTAEEIMDTLDVARSNVSNSLRELQSWGIVKLSHVMGDKRDHFESMEDVWEMFRIVLDERKKREIDPTGRLLRECMKKPKRGRRPTSIPWPVAQAERVLRDHDRLVYAGSQLANGRPGQVREARRQGAQGAGDRRLA